MSSEPLTKAELARDAELWRLGPNHPVEAALRAKCNWEHMSRTAVIREWGDPSTWRSARERGLMSSEIPRDRYGRLVLSSEERSAVNRFIFDVLLFQGPPPLNAHGMRGLTREQQSESYQSWARGGRAWMALEQGGTGQLAAICWYQHFHRPGSREWRPSIIIRALVSAALAALPGGGPSLGVDPTV